MTSMAKSGTIRDCSLEGTGVRFESISQVLRLHRHAHPRHPRIIQGQKNCTGQPDVYSERSRSHVKMSSPAISYDVYHSEVHLLRR